ncbi:allantoate permease [Magnaporthiopsis poae ATCC 64411]|uniref:Allantoate permease n=1 Tax=Magnaporthiopsis poae (strain ATCC 64411 / 73-15) TaxID=644358 RepID=A0A0C4EGK8_MAGP6|nr:allantoate permease [Magnaporthiopsis poae ATCC 64411]
MSILLGRLRGRLGREFTYLGARADRLHTYSHQDTCSIVLFRPGRCTPHQNELASTITMEEKPQHETASGAARLVSKFSKEVTGKDDTQTSGAAADLSDIDIQDETGSIAARALACGDLDPEESRLVRRKLDAYILPCLCVTYALQFMDKASLTNSSVYGIIQDTHLTGQDFSWASSIFFFGFLVGQYPGIALIQRFPIAKFLGASVISCGLVVMATAASSNFAGLATARFILGAVESTFSPGFVAVTSMFWTRREQATRSALWLGCVGFGGFIGALAVFGIGHIQGSLSSWRYIFLFLGSITVFWGIVFLIFVPDSPAKVRFLTEEQKVVAVQRVIENKMGTKSRRFVMAQVIEAVTDPKVILVGLLQFVIAVPAGGFAFGPLLIAGFGFSPLQTTLMTLPSSAIQSITQVGSGLLAARIANSRLNISSIAMVPPIIGTILISQLSHENKWGRTAGYWLLGFHAVSYTAVVGLMGTNVAGSTKRSVALGWGFMCFGAGQIAGPQFFRSTEAPHYKSGITSMLVNFILIAVLSQALRLLYVMENRRRDKLLAEKSPEEIEEMKRISNRQGFEDVTDKDNLLFRYAM